MNRHLHRFYVNRRLTLVALAGMVTCVGCSGGNLGAVVDGNVTLDGESIGPGVVVFAPLEAKENPATGTIQPDGTYFVKTGGEVGLPVGTYRVCVYAYEESTDRERGERTMTPSKSIIPKKYTSIETSGLRFDVSRGRNTIDLELTSDAAG